MTAARSRGGRTDESTDRRSATKQKLQEELASLRARLAYAEQMLETLTADPGLSNAHGGSAPRPADRPVTKFERRALAAGRWIFDLEFTRK